MPSMPNEVQRRFFSTAVTRVHRQMPGGARWPTVGWRTMPKLAIHALAIACGVSACRPSSEASVPPSIYDGIPYREGEVGERTRVFLVAGGDDVANFAAEVLEQRQLWLTAGVGEDEIACYYAKPTAQAWADDLQQYRAIANLVRACYPAEPARLRRDLLAAAERDPQWVYLYVTGHGLESQTAGLPYARSRRLRRIAAGMGEGERALLDAPAIGLEAGPGPGLGEVSRLVRELRRGVAPADLVFTPVTLGDTLRAFADSTIKVVVLQACFSGGFIDHHVPGGKRADTGPGLTAVPNLVALTATAAERPSFGCGSGNHRTYFGGALNRALAWELEPGDRPPDLDWKAIHDRTAFAVEAMEAVDAETRSFPGFVDTR
jgi:hypothetical protein